MFLFFHEAVHLSAGLLIGFIFGKKYKERKLIIISVATALLIDSDHLFDLIFYWFTNPTLNIFLIPLTNFFLAAGKTYVPLHSLELIPLLLLAGFIREKWRAVLWTIAFSALLHIMIDQLTYHSNILEYSFIYRLANSFSNSAFY